MLCWVVSQTNKGGRQVFRSRTTRMKVRSTSQSDMKSQCGRLPRKTNRTQLIWIFIRLRITVGNNPLLLLHLQVVHIIKKSTILLVAASKEWEIAHLSTRAFLINQTWLKTQRHANNNNKRSSNSRETSRSRRCKWWMSTQRRVWAISKRLHMQGQALEMGTSRTNTVKLGDWYLATTVEGNSTSRRWWSILKFVRKFS